MVYTCAEETNFWQVCDKPAKWNWHGYSATGHNWVSLEYYNFNLYLAITRLIHEERLVVCDHEIIKVKQIAETMYAMKCKKWRTWSLCVVNM